MSPIYHCDYVRQEFKRMSECCPSCHGSEAGARMTLSHPQRIQGTPKPVNVCCRVLRCLDERGLVEKGEA